MSTEYLSHRRDYSRAELNEGQKTHHPFELFEEWLAEASKTEPDANATILSTVSEGRPTGRVVLLRDITKLGLVFYSNYQSRKGHELASNPHACLTFFWPSCEQQVRFEGRVEKVSENVSTDYFNSRPRDSKIGAWASEQSKSIPSREYLEQRVEEFSERFDAGEVPRPTHWGGYELLVERAEFWQGRESRLHDRLEYHLEGGVWRIERLAP